MDFKPSNRKREQKTSLFFHEISNLIRTLALDESDLLKVFVTKVSLSNDYSICYVYFSTYTDKSDFDKALPILKLYKSSLRKAMAQAISSRYAADLVFFYDETKDKERKINALLDEAVKDLPKD